MRQKIVYGINIMWFEYGMAVEHFKSVLGAYQFVKDSVDLELKVYANRQTYIEEPVSDEIFTTFEDTLVESLIGLHMEPNVSVDLQWIEMDREFWCAPDARRETKNPDGWVVWGEIDCLLPDRFFVGLIESSKVIPDPTYALTWAYRKMWDATWNPVEHQLFQYAAYNESHRDMVVAPFNYHDRITQSELNAFNGRFPHADLMKVFPAKLDGSLLAFYKLEDQLLPDDMHLGADDTCAMFAMDILGIPQYHVANIIKGHNYQHPNKQIGRAHV